MPLWVGQLLITIIAITVMVWIACRPFARNLQTLKTYSLRLLICYVLAMAIWRMTDTYQINITDMITASLFVSIVTWCSLSIIWRPAKNTFKQGKKRHGHLGNLCLNLIILLISIIGIDILNTLEASTRSQHTPDQAQQLKDVMAQQNLFLSRLGMQASEARDWLYDVTGIRGVVEQISALQEILALSHAQRARIIESNPQLVELTQHPAILKVIHNPHVVELITQAGEGHMQAIWQLQKEPDIAALLNDRSLLKQMSALNVRDILKQYHQSQWQDQPLLPVMWYVTSLNDASTLPTVLDDPSQWTPAQAIMRWENESPYHAAWAELHAQMGREIQLVITTDATISVFADGQTLTLRMLDDNTQMVVLTSTGKPISICVLLDARELQPPHACEISVKVR